MVSQNRLFSKNLLILLTDKVIESYANQLNVKIDVYDVVTRCHSQLQSVLYIQMKNLDNSLFFGNFHTIFLSADS